MTCSVATAPAVTVTPVFSPSHTGPLSCKASLETLTMSHLHGGEVSPSPSSPFRPRFSKDPAGRRSPAKKDASFRSFDACSTIGSVGAAVKRKRPAKIVVPQCPAVGVGAWRAVENVVQVEGEGYSVYCKRGRVREQMEDRFDAAVDVDGDGRVAFFGVFDGHGGAKVAEYVSKKLKTHVMDELRKAGDGANEVEEAVKAGYQSMDLELGEKEVAGGACSVTALIRNGELVVSNAGDCRAVMSRGGVAEAITSDHRPSRPDERERIEHLGGFVECLRGVWRLQGSLAVSRGFGDAHLKQWVTAEPETSVLDLKPDCEFLILASDGLWEKVSNQEAVDIARPMCVNKASLLLACKSLAELSVSRGSADDASVMIIQLRHFAKKGV